MGGAIKELLRLLGAASGGGGREEKAQLQLQTVELRVRMDCERCEREVRKALAGIRGVQRVEVSRRQQKVAVTGNVDPDKVLRRARSTGKRAEMWAQSPGYGGAAAAAAHYYGLGAGAGAGAAQAHDRLWAPACYPPRSAAEAAIGAEHFTSLFSDDNPNACSLM